jgi:hypothetical protein
MRTSVYGLFVAIAFGAASLAASGQTQFSGEPGGLDVVFTYNPMLANVTTSNQFWLQGGSAQVHDQFWHGFGIAGDVIGLHTGNMNNTGAGLDLMAYTAGPRYTFGSGRMSFFGEALAGEAHGSNSIFPTGNVINSSGNSLALQVGGGMNLPISRHLTVRAFEADWLRTQLPNATTNVQNNVRLGAGVGYHF